MMYKLRASTSYKTQITQSRVSSSWDMLDFQSKWGYSDHLEL